MHDDFEYFPNLSRTRVLSYRILDFAQNSRRGDQTHLVLWSAQGAIAGMTYEWDEDALLAQAKEGIDSQEFEVVYVGSLSNDVDLPDQEQVSSHLMSRFNCLPVFIAPDLREKYYKTFWCVSNCSAVPHAAARSPDLPPATLAS